MMDELLLVLALGACIVLFVLAIVTIAVCICGFFVVVLGILDYFCSLLGICTEEDTWY